MAVTHTSEHVNVPLADRRYMLSMRCRPNGTGQADWDQTPKHVADTLEDLAHLVRCGAIAIGEEFKIRRTT